MEEVVFVDRLASLLAHSIFAISVANHPGISGMAHVMMNLMTSIICCEKYQIQIENSTMRGYEI